MAKLKNLIRIFVIASLAFTFEVSASKLDLKGEENVSLKAFDITDSSSSIETSTPSSFDTETSINETVELLPTRKLEKLKTKFEAVYGSDIPELFEFSEQDYFWFSHCNPEDVADPNFWKVVINYCVPGMPLKSCANYARFVALNLVNHYWSVSKDVESKYIHALIYILLESEQFGMMFEVCSIFLQLDNPQIILAYLTERDLIRNFNNLDSSKFERFISTLNPDQLRKLLTRFIDHCHNDYPKVYEAFYPFAFRLIPDFFSHKFWTSRNEETILYFYTNSIDYSIIHRVKQQYLSETEHQQFIINYLNTGEFEIETYAESTLLYAEDLPDNRRIFNAAMAKNDVQTVMKLLVLHPVLFRSENHEMNIFDFYEFWSPENVETIYENFKDGFIAAFIFKCVKSYPDDESFQMLAEIVHEVIKHDNSDDSLVDILLSKYFESFTDMIHFNPYADFDTLFAIIGALVTDPIALEDYLLACFELIPEIDFHHQIQQMSALFRKTRLSTTIHLMNNPVIREEFAEIADNINFRDYDISELMTVFRVESHSDSIYVFRKSFQNQLYFPKIIFYLESIEEAALYLNYFHDVFSFDMIPKELQNYRQTGLNFLMEAALYRIPDTLHFLKGEYLVKATQERLEEVHEVLRKWILHEPTEKVDSFTRNASECGISLSNLIGDALKYET